MYSSHKNLREVHSYKSHHLFYRSLAPQFIPSGNQFCLAYSISWCCANEAIINHKILSMSINLCTCILALITHSRHPINKKKSKRKAGSSWEFSSMKEWLNKCIKNLFKGSQNNYRTLKDFNFSLFFKINKS